MRVNHNSLLAERMRKDDVRSLASNARECREKVHLGSHGAPPFFGEFERLGNDGPRLVVEEAGRLDDLFDRKNIGVTQSRWSRIGSKQKWRNLVDHDVSALGTEYRCREQLPWVVELQSGASPGIGLLECGHHLSNVLLPCECHLNFSSPYSPTNKPTPTRNRCFTSKSSRNQMKLPV